MFPKAWNGLCPPAAQKPRLRFVPLLLLSVSISQKPYMAPLPEPQTCAAFKMVACNGGCTLENCMPEPEPEPEPEPYCSPSHTDKCGVCDMNTTNDCQQDCSGVWAGTAVIDECSVCGGSDECYDCSGLHHDGDPAMPCNETGFLPTGLPCKNLDKCGLCDANKTNDCIADCSGALLPPDNVSFKRVDKCGKCGGDHVCLKHTKVAAASKLAGGVSPETLAASLASMAGGDTEGVAVQVKITKFEQKADASLSLGGMDPSMLDKDTEAGRAALDQIFSGVAAQLGIDVAAIELSGVTGSGRRQLLDLATLAYGVTAETDINSLMSRAFNALHCICTVVADLKYACADASFGSLLTSAINDAPGPMAPMR
jgi:hypothetical protein